MFQNFRQRNLIRFWNLFHFKGQKCHTVRSPTTSLKDLTETILDYTNFIKLIGTVTDCRPIANGYLYTVAQVNNSSNKKTIEHKLYISAQNSKDLALRMLKNGQRINVSGYIRSHSFSKTFLRISNVLAGCRISIIPKTIQLSDDEVDYMDKCIAILQGHVRSDLQCDADSCKFVLETRMTERNDLGEIIDRSIPIYHLIVIKEPELMEIFNRTIRKYDDVILEGHIDYHGLDSIGAIYPYKLSKIDRMAILAIKSDDDESDDDDDGIYMW